MNTNSRILFNINENLHTQVWEGGLTLHMHGTTQRVSLLGGIQSSGGNISFFYGNMEITIS